MDDKFSLNIGSISGQQVNVGQNVTAIQNNQTNSLIKNIEVLHIIGEEKFGNDDAIALKNSGIKNKTVQANIEPFFEILKDEIFRQREDNNVSKYWHISAHGQQKAGLLFGRKWINWNDFNALLSPYDELQILFLAACESIIVADEVSGLFKYVIASTLKISNKTSIKATEIFWKNINMNQDVDRAFNALKTNIPEFSQHFRIRGIF